MKYVPLTGDENNTQQKAQIRNHLHADSLKQPDCCDRLAKRYCTQVKIPRPTKSSIQAAYEEFIGEAGQDIEIAVTLTFRDSALRMGGISARLNVEKTVRHYVKPAKQACFWARCRTQWSDAYGDFRNRRRGLSQAASCPLGHLSAEAYRPANVDKNRPQGSNAM